MKGRWLGDDVVPGALVELAEQIESMWSPLQDGFMARLSVLLPDPRHRPPNGELPAVFGALIAWFAAPDDLIDRLRALRSTAWMARAELHAYQRVADALDWTFRDLLAESYAPSHVRAFGNSSRLMLALVQRLRDVEALNDAQPGGDGRTGRAWELRDPNGTSVNAMANRAYVRPTVQRLDTRPEADGRDASSPFNETTEL